MNAQQISRTVDSIKETKRLLSKELGYQKHLQRHDMVSFYQGHIQKLETMLSDAWSGVEAK